MRQLQRAPECTLHHARDQDQTQEDLEEVDPAALGDAVEERDVLREGTRHPRSHRVGDLLDQRGDGHDHDDPGLVPLPDGDWDQQSREEEDDRGVTRRCQLGCDQPGHHRERAGDHGGGEVAPGHPGWDVDHPRADGSEGGWSSLVHRQCRGHVRWRGRGHTRTRGPRPRRTAPGGADGGRGGSVPG